VFAGDLTLSLQDTYKTTIDAIVKMVEDCRFYIFENYRTAYEGFGP
jgi:hypothetical protein